MFTCSTDAKNQIEALPQEPVATVIWVLFFPQDTLSVHARSTVADWGARANRGDIGFSCLTVFCDPRTLKYTVLLPWRRDGDSNHYDRFIKAKPFFGELMNNPTYHEYMYEQGTGTLMNEARLCAEGKPPRSAQNATSQEVINWSPKDVGEGRQDKRFANLYWKNNAAGELALLRCAADHGYSPEGERRPLAKASNIAPFVLPNSIATPTFSAGADGKLTLTGSVKLRESEILEPSLSDAVQQEILAIRPACEQTLVTLALDKAVASIDKTVVTVGDEWVAAKWLPDAECRYVVYTDPLTVDVCLLFWAPDKAPADQKIWYADMVDRVSEKLGDTTPNEPVRTKADLHKQLQTDIRKPGKRERTAVKASIAEILSWVPAGLVGANPQTTYPDKRFANLRWVTGTATTVRFESAKEKAEPFSDQAPFLLSDDSIVPVTCKIENGRVLADDQYLLKELGLTPADMERSFKSPGDGIISDRSNNGMRKINARAMLTLKRTPQDPKNWVAEVHFAADAFYWFIGWFYNTHNYSFVGTLSREIGQERVDGNCYSGSNSGRVVFKKPIPVNSGDYELFWVYNRYSDRTNPNHREADSCGVYTKFTFSSAG